MIELKLRQNLATLYITYNGLDTRIYDLKKVLGVVDLRSLGYYKIKLGILQQNLSKYYIFEKADTLCKQFNRFINTLKKDRQLEESKENYPWLDASDERKYMTDREILENYIDLEKSCLTERERKEVIDMLYKYKGAFSLRDEIGTCPNIEVEIDVTDKSPFFIRPYHVKEEDKTLIHREMKHLQYLGILKEGFSAYSSPVMLISRKVTQDKRMAMDFRHLNVRIVKNNLAYPFLKDTFQCWAVPDVRYCWYET